MTLTPKELQGRILETWRHKAGMALEDLRCGLPTPPQGISTLSNWESGYRTPDLATVEEIAKALGLKPKFRVAMVQMWQAARMITGFSPRIEWSHNFPLQPVDKGEQAAWVWMRTNPEMQDEVRARLTWGPFSRTIALSRTVMGTLVQAPTSVPNPPLVITFEGPGAVGGGWCAFGSGTVHIDVMRDLGIEYRRAHMLIIEQPHQKPLTANVIPNDVKNKWWLDVMRATAKDLKIDFDESVWQHLGALTPGKPSHQLAESKTVLAAPLEHTRSDSDGLVATQLLVEPGQMHLVRDARGMSRGGAAARANAESSVDDGKPMTARMIEHLEIRRQLPAAQDALARLDIVYQADGWLAATRTYDSRETPHKEAPKRRRDKGEPSAFPVTFPSFWVGPIWLQPWHDDPNAECTVSLEWDGWKRNQVVRSHSLLTTRRAHVKSGTLRVAMPDGWHLVAGVGSIPEAGDINVGWYPASPGMLLTLVGSYLRLLGRQIHRVVDDDEVVINGKRGASSRNPRLRTSERPQP